MQFRLRMTISILAGLAAGLSACATPPDEAPADPALAHGQAMARQYCAACHAVGVNDASRMANAIPFRDLSQLYPVEGLAEALVEGLVTGHPDMPEFQFSAEAANDFIRYLDSIQSN